MDTNPQMRHDDIRSDNPLGLEVYSSDGQLVGRIGGYLEEVREDEQEVEGSQVDLVNRKGELLGPRHVVIDGHGYVTQALIAVPLTQLNLDFNGRRATLTLTLAQIEAMPHHEPDPAK